jgi:hypothetical protein
MIRVPLFDLKFLNELAATTVGTSNRRHSPACAEETSGVAWPRRIDDLPPRLDERIVPSRARHVHGTGLNRSEIS